jgi:regulator of protease activity HflC (stomatin/prohibitin superfamily)
MQIPSQKIITKDNVSIDIAAVAYYHISDPEKAVIVIENVFNAINQISQVLSATLSGVSALTNFSQTPRASMSRSRMLSMGTRNPGVPR